VDFQQPATRWLGEGYFDINHGDAPLEQDFAGWELSRAGTRSGKGVCYDTSARGSVDTSLALRFGRAGNVEHLEPLSRTKLSSTGWRIRRTGRSDAEQPINVTRTLE